jgi:hypothetical protein
LNKRPRLREEELTKRNLRTKQRQKPKLLLQPQGHQLHKRKQQLSQQLKMLEDLRPRNE